MLRWSNQWALGVRLWRTFYKAHAKHLVQVREYAAPNGWVDNSRHSTFIVHDSALATESAISTHPLPLLLCLCTAKFTLQRRGEWPAEHPTNLHGSGNVREKHERKQAVALV